MNPGGGGGGGGGGDGGALSGARGAAVYGSIAVSACACLALSIGCCCYLHRAHGLNDLLERCTSPERTDEDVYELQDRAHHDGVRSTIVAYIGFRRLIRDHEGASLLSDALSVRVAGSRPSSRPRSVAGSTQTASVNSMVAPAHQVIEVRPAGGPRGSPRTGSQGNGDALQTSEERSSSEERDGSTCSYETRCRIHNLPESQINMLIDRKRSELDLLEGEKGRRRTPPASVDSSTKTQSEPAVVRPRHVATLRETYGVRQTSSSQTSSSSVTENDRTRLLGCARSDASNHPGIEMQTANLSLSNPTSHNPIIKSPFYSAQLRPKPQPQSRSQPNTSIQPSPRTTRRVRVRSPPSSRPSSPPASVASARTAARPSLRSTSSPLPGSLLRELAAQRESARARVGVSPRQSPRAIASGGGVSRAPALSPLPSLPSKGGSGSESSSGDFEHLKRHFGGTGRGK